MTTRNDGRLLSEVASDGSEKAFEELIQRHGSMVLNQCLRLLQDRQDAEDAMQAVFLVLWKKAASLQNRLSVASWIHRTTRNVCRNALRSRHARKINEEKAMETKQPYSNEHNQWKEIEPVLDDELNRLPEKYRLPLVLFHLEGRQLEEIAKLTNSNISTIGTRLRRGREMLRTRIARRGITIETASLFAAIGVHAGVANLSASTVSATVKSASVFAAGKILPTTLLSSQAMSLAKGTLQMLTITKLKIATSAVAAILVLGSLSSAVVNAVLDTDTPEISESDQRTLNKIVATLEKQREQVKSLTIETKSYDSKLAEPQVLQALQRFQGMDFFSSEEKIQENIFAYRGGNRYLRIHSTRVKKLDDNETTSNRRVTYNSERASDGVNVWERRVDLTLGPAQVFVFPVEPGSLWTQNPVYCSNFGWDCMTELHTQDEATLERHRKVDFLTLLKKGEYSLDAGTTMLDGVKCVVLRRKYQAELAEYDTEKEETVVFKDPATETIWLDTDRGFAMLRRDQQFQRWGLDRTSNSEFVEILPGIWFPQKTKTQPFAPPDAPQEYQGRPILSWHQDLVRWSVNDVPDSRFDMVTKPSDHLIEGGKPVRVIGENGQPINPTDSSNEPKFSNTQNKASLNGATILPSSETELVNLFTKSVATNQENSRFRIAVATGEGCNPPWIFSQFLEANSECQCKEVALSDIGEGVLDSCEVVLIPGGNAKKQAKQLGETGVIAIRKFVDSGGGYVGVCAGGKLATTNFEWSLKLINAQTLSDKRQSPGPDGVMTVDMGKRGSGTVTMELTDAGRKIFDGGTGLIETGFHLGPVFLPNKQSDLPRCMSLGDYRSEVWLHSLQIGTMVNTPSILAAQYGKGRVIIFSSHPEGRQETKPILMRAVLATAHNSTLVDD